MIRILIAALALSLSAAPALAADPDSPHPHHGVLAPYANPPKATSLTAEQEALLGTGAPVYTQVESKDGGRGAAVFLVDAAPTKVWSTIKRFDQYPGWIDGVKECEVYKQEGDHTYARFKIGRMGVNVEYFIDHTYPAGQTWGTWTLDYSKKSDLDDSVGSWRVTAVPGNPNQSRVEYSVDIKVSGWVPGFIRDMIVKQGLQDATSWVKARSVG